MRRGEERKGQVLFRDFILSQFCRKKVAQMSQLYFTIISGRCWDRDCPHYGAKLKMRRGVLVDGDCPFEVACRLRQEEKFWLCSRSRMSAVAELWSRALCHSEGAWRLRNLAWNAGWFGGDFDEEL